MAGITAAHAETQLALWLAADAAVARGQSYTIDGRTVMRAQALEIRRNIEFWDQQCKRLGGSRAGLKVKGVTPV